MSPLQLLQRLECLGNSTETTLRNRQKKESVAFTGTAVQQDAGADQSLIELPFSQKRSDPPEFFGYGPLVGVGVGVSVNPLECSHGSRA